MCIVHLGAHHTREGRGRVTDDLQMCEATLLTLIQFPDLVVDQDLLIQQIRALRDKGKLCDGDSSISLWGGISYGPRLQAPVSGRATNKTMQPHPGSGLERGRL